MFCERKLEQILHSVDMNMKSYWSLKAAHTITTCYKGYNGDVIFKQEQPP